MRASGIGGAGVLVAPKGAVITAVACISGSAVRVGVAVGKETVGLELELGATVGCAGGVAETVGDDLPVLSTSIGVATAI